MIVILQKLKRDRNCLHGQRDIISYTYIKVYKGKCSHQVIKIKNT